MQRSILNALNENGGRASTNILMQAIETQSGKKTYPVSFYRALNSLQEKNLVKWFKEHGGVNSPHGLVCANRKNVLLVDVDSKIGNIALMKISQYHKQQGHNVYLQQGIEIENTIDIPEIVYISCLFTWNGSAAKKLKNQFQSLGVVVHIGGSGIALSKALPEDIENTRPDYTLYPEFNYNLMYLSRGCPRSCKFCSVPKMQYEGKPHPVGDIYDFWDGRTSEVQILDNNILALPEHFKKIAKQIIKEKLKVKFHALDIRFINDENAALLKQMNIHISKPNFSFDDTKDEDSVVRGIETLRRNNIKHSKFYVLAGFESDFEDALYRVNLLRNIGQYVFIMIYDVKNQTDQRYFQLRNYCNAHRIFCTVPFEEYVAKCD
jgi:Fe2+ or Zn2+ uptake regulation protein